MYNKDQEHTASHREAVMENLNIDAIYIHQEFIRHEASLRLALKQSAIYKPPIHLQVLIAIGDLLCRVGSRLKEHSYRRLTSVEASAPTYIIML
jgi:hypothetical protein